MIVNIDAISWARDDYNPSCEDYYESNAQYMFSRQWYQGMLYHTVTMAVFFVISLFVFKSFVTSLELLGTMCLSFFCFGLLSYVGSRETLGYGTYVFVLLALPTAKLWAPSWLLITISLILMVLYVLVGLQVFSLHKKAKKVHDDQDNDDKNLDRSGFSDFDHYLNTPRRRMSQQEADEIHEQAASLLRDYVYDPCMFANRFNFLSKTMNPAAGGDVDVYQELVYLKDQLEKIRYGSGSED